MKELGGQNVILKDNEFLTKERLNKEYLFELKSDALLQNYYQEAGMNQNFGSKFMAHGGWEDPSCQLRGHFLGHYLSACAMNYYETKDEELLAKANAIVRELKKCQIENGGIWAASIPEKYFHWIARGKAVWAPHYTVHKTFMGLCDMYRYANNSEALEVAVKFSEWFYDYTKNKTREEMDNILDFETGGMLEIWADLYEFTNDKRYLELIDKYDRRRLFDPLLKGIDVLTNMHANTTIPEAIGAARVYEVTGNERFKKIALSYWELAVSKRGYFVTGGQTCGEIWTPMHSMAERLGDKNQEHCTVYNMIRLADILFKWTADKKYLDYIEQNIYNGIFSQGYFRGGHANGQTADYPEEGLITYFQPLFGGAKKGWGTKFSDFFCCHGTLVQANASFNKYIFYREDEKIYTGLYAASSAVFSFGNDILTIEEYNDTLSGSFHISSTSNNAQSIGEDTFIYTHQPDVLKMIFRIKASNDLSFKLYMRLPKWLKTKAVVEVNNNLYDYEEENGYAIVDRVFKDNDEISITLPMCIYTTLLEGSNDMVAFSYGPYVLAAYSDCERTLYKKNRETEELLVHDNEREWGSWKKSFKTIGQNPSLKFVPLNTIGYEKYQVYFPISE